MSCDACGAAQENPIESVYYIRVGTGNVMIVGCEDHASRVIDAVNEHA